MGRREGALLLLAALCGCHGKNDALLVVGVEAQPAVVSRIGKVHYLATAGGKTLVDEEIVPKTGESPFPLTVKVASTAGAEADVLIEAYSALQNGAVAPKPMLTRRARAPFAAGPAQLVRLRLESSCLRGTPGFKGPACPATQTCSQHRCIDPTLLAEDLEPFAEDWAKNRPDACKAAGGGDPSIEIGTGQTDYVAISDGVTLAPEKGPQGGHHLWIALRTRNVKQTGSSVAITAEQPGTGLKVPPTTFVFPLEPADHGYCKLYGLRLQLDNASVPVQSFLGQPLDLRVTVTDSDGKTASAGAHVNVDPKTVGD
jgi:hypothetical protein